MQKLNDKDYVGLAATLFGLTVALGLCLAQCRQPVAPPAIWPPPAAAVDALPAQATPTNLPVGLSATAASTAVGSTLTLTNATTKPTTVFVAFGADSVVLPATWPFCTATAPLNCSFALAANTPMALSLAGAHINATFSFDAPVGCGSSKAELNLNNPQWYDVIDLSLVDGFNHNLGAKLGVQQLGPTNGKDNNSKVFGVYPFGCDICVARHTTSCGLPPSPTPGSAGCKQGSQYAPDVPCQAQGATMGGGSAVVVTLLP